MTNHQLMLRHLDRLGTPQAQGTASTPIGLMGYTYFSLDVQVFKLNTSNTSTVTLNVELSSIFDYIRTTKRSLGDCHLPSRFCHLKPSATVDGFLMRLMTVFI